MNTLPCLRSHCRNYRKQSGQAIVESILACSILALLMLGVTWIWKFGELKQYNTEAVRFAAWERTVYHPDSGEELKTLYGSDAELAKETFRYTYLTARGRRNADADGGTLIGGNEEWGSIAARFFKDWIPNGTFNGLINNALKVSTSSQGVPGGAPNGFEPTGNTVTSLNLDKNPYDTVSITAQANNNFFTNFFRRIGIVPAEPAPENLIKDMKLGSLSLITSSYAGPGTVGIRRIFKELSPLSTVNYLGHYGVNNPTAFNFSQFLGGQAGFAGNYRVDMAGINPSQIGTLFNNALSGNWSKNPDSYIAAFNPTNAYLETMSVAPEGTARYSPDYAGLYCTTKVPDTIRLQAYRQDASCPMFTARPRVMLFFDNPAYRYSTTER